MFKVIQKKPLTGLRKSVQRSCDPYSLALLTRLDNANSPRNDIPKPVSSISNKVHFILFMLHYYRTKKALLLLKKADKIRDFIVDHHNAPTHYISLQKHTQTLIKVQ